LLNITFFKATIELLYNFNKYRKIRFGRCLEVEGSRGEGTNLEEKGWIWRRRDGSRGEGMGLKEKGWV